MRCYMRPSRETRTLRWFDHLACVRLCHLAKKLLHSRWFDHLLHASVCLLAKHAHSGGLTMRCYMRPSLAEARTHSGGLTMRCCMRPPSLAKHCTLVG
jgi:hypothetical protein